MARHSPFNHRVKPSDLSPYSGYSYKQIFKYPDHLPSRPSVYLFKKYEVTFRGNVIAIVSTQKEAKELIIERAKQYGY